MNRQHTKGWPILKTTQTFRTRQLLPLAAALFSGLWACSDAGTSAAPATASTSVVPAPHVDDPVADWELQYLPAIDAHMKAGQLDSVITVCQLGIDGDSTRIVLYNLMASAYAGQGLYGAAAQALETAVRLSPDFTVGWANLGGMYARLGRHDEALPYLQRAADLDADNAAARRRLAESLLATHQYIRAAAEIRATLALLPDDATLTLLLGESQQGLGQTTDALASFLRAGALDPGFDAAHTHAAEAARQLGQQVVADSCQFLQEHLQQIAAGDTAALTTKTRLRDAVTNAPEEPIHQARLGGFYLYHKYLPEALALFHRASRLRPNDLWLINEFGGLLSRTGNGDEALGFYLQALQVNPDYGPALINAGGILNALQRHEEALRHFEHALTLSPEDPGIRFFLGVTYISLERYDDARTQLQQALASLDDSDEAARLQPQIEAALEALPR